jgi:hypothetical protein
MDEHRAAAAGNAGPRVMINLDNEIVEMILTRQAIGSRMGADLDGLIVMAIGGVFTPAVRRSDALCRERGKWTCVPVRTPPEPAEAERAARGAAITFAFVGLNSAASERHRQYECSGRKPATPGIARLAAYRNPGQRSFSCDWLHLGSSRFGPKYQFTLALLALNVLFRDCRNWRVGAI